jgi:hypothetical protein
MRKEHGKTKNKWAYKKLPTYMIRSKIIMKMPKTKIPNKNFSLRTNPFVLFRKTFNGQPFAFKKTIRLTSRRQKKLLTTTKSQESVKLTIANPQFCSH